MKKLLFLIPILAALTCPAQTVTVSAPLSSGQKAALKYLMSVNGVTNQTAAQYATNYATLAISDVVYEASRLRRNAIAAKLASASDDALTAVESVLQWTAETDLTRNQSRGITDNVSLLPLAMVDGLTAAPFVLAWTNRVNATKLGQITNLLWKAQNATAAQLTNAVEALQ